MSKNPHERKRREKAAKQRRRERESESLAYMGEKYKKDKLIPTWMHAEIGIYQTYVVSQRKLVDKTVISALEKLIRLIRARKLPPLPETKEIHYEVGREEDLLIENVRRSWRQHFATEWRPPTDDLVGVLRTILGSIEKVKSSGSYSQSYLKHIEGFLTKKLGISVREVSADFEPIPEPEDQLLRLGRQWIETGNLEARAEFFEHAMYLMKNGNAVQVTDACLVLTGAVSDPSSEIVAELIDLTHQARKSHFAEMS